MYIMYSNKDERLSVVSDTVPLMSGNLKHCTRFTPKLYNKSLKTLVEAWLSDCKLLRFETLQVNLYPKNVYKWLRNKKTNVVYKVWGLDNREPNTSKILSDNKIMIKGVGVFDFDVFEEFVIL